MPYKFAVPCNDIYARVFILSQEHLNLWNSMNRPHVIIITPCYNEGQVITCFLSSLEQAVSTLPFFFRVVVVNDGSVDDTSKCLDNFCFEASNMVLDVVHLPKNMGHQRAIYEGFAHVQNAKAPCYIVMDSDGEDSPAIVPELLQHADADIVHVVRGRRRESRLFMLCYYTYRVLFRLLTGRKMRYGNFCLIGHNVLKLAVNKGFTHLAAFLSKQEGDVRHIIAEKGNRLGGSSKMNFGKWVRHAVDSFGEYGYGSEVPFFKKTASR